jgi:sulfide:quinone oxidoreductase
MRRDSAGEADDDSASLAQDLWWPPTKIAGRELAAYLEGFDETAGRPSGLVVNVSVGGSDTGEIEVLSLH